MSHWGLGIEHEFATEFGRVDTPQKEAFLRKHHITPIRGQRVILDLGSLTRYPKTNRIVMCPNPSPKHLVAPNRTVQVMFPDACVETLRLPLLTAHDSLEDQRKKVQDVVDKHKEVLERLGGYSSLTIAGKKELFMLPTESAKQVYPPQDVLHNILLQCYPSNVPIEIENAMHVPILTEVKSCEFFRETPTSIFAQLQENETIATNSQRRGV